jgi:hypothetical protein
MNFIEMEATVRQFADEFWLAPTEDGQQRVLKAWRAKLAKEPISLLAFRIDGIVREVRRRKDRHGRAA